MLISLLRGALVPLVLSATSAWAAVHYVDAGGTNPVSPYLDWSTAATNIQDAIGAAAAGEVVWVTNGIYASGGKAMIGGPTNRVALDKALTVRSVNGPWVTTIQGAWNPGTTNGALAVRCAWLGNGAVLAGFTLQGGATGTNGPFSYNGGGGAWCNSASATLSNCIIAGNASWVLGSGVYQGTLKNCFVHGNVGDPYAGATYSCVLSSCTVSGNAVGGTSLGNSTNSIIYNNSPNNYSQGTFAFCCTTPLPAGSGNLNSDPQLLPDGLHLASTSPCRGAGSNTISATDLDGAPWSNPPTLGCQEWQPEPAIVLQPQLSLRSTPPGFSLSMSVAGQDPFSCFWTRDGVPLADDGHYSATGTLNLQASGVTLQDAGSYRAMISNAFGVVTSAVTRVVVHCVDAAGSAPVPPYADWASAATTIQDAIEVSARGDFVLVTNGVYVTGGKAMAGDLTNRVTLDKAVLVKSVNGPQATIIQGAWDPTSINGPMAVRCAWLTNGAVLAGFRLQGGATRNIGDLLTLQSGGGAWSASTNACIFGCQISTNAAAQNGGGACQGQLERCVLLGNSSQWGGGAYQSTLRNCLLQTNFATLLGGGAYGGTIINSTLTCNTGPFPAAGVGSRALIYNSIIYNNFPTNTSFQSSANCDSLCMLQYSCTIPSRPGTANIGVDPQLLDGIHLTSTSPCLGTGSTNYSSGADIDGEAWAIPPSMGCDEYVESSITGPLAVTAKSVSPVAVAGKALLCYGQITGRATRAEWSFGDGFDLTNASVLTLNHTWTNPGDYTVTFTAFNADNPAGVSTNFALRVDPLTAPTLSFAGSSSNGLSISFLGQFGVLYYLEQATNLVPPIVWQAAAIRGGSGGPLVIGPFGMTNQSSFFRIRTQ